MITQNARVVFSYQQRFETGIVEKIDGSEAIVRLEHWKGEGVKRVRGPLKALKLASALSDLASPPPAVQERASKAALPPVILALIDRGMTWQANAVIQVWNCPDFGAPYATAMAEAWLA